MPTKRSVAVVAVPPVGTGTRIRCKAAPAIVALIDSFSWDNVSLHPCVVIHLFRQQTCLWGGYIAYSALQQCNTGRKSRACACCRPRFTFSSKSFDIMPFASPCSCVLWSVSLHNETRLELMICGNNLSTIRSDIESRGLAVSTEVVEWKFDEPSQSGGAGGTPLARCFTCVIEYRERAYRMSNIPTLLAT